MIYLEFLTIVLHEIDDDICLIRRVRIKLIYEYYYMLQRWKKFGHGLSH